MMLCIYLVANLANDWAIRFLGSRAYLSLIAGAVLPLLCIGTISNGFQPTWGRWWGAFMLWMILCIPVSSWPGGSFGTWKEFATKNYPIFFYCAASAVSMAQVRTLFRTLIFGGFIVVVSCVFFGDGSSGRLSIPDSIFFDNSNDLALQLLISAGFFLFLLMSRSWLSRIAGVLLVGGALMYMLKTGSRANFISLMVASVAALMLVRRKAVLLGSLFLVVILAAASVSSQQWSRLFYVVLSDEAQNSEENLNNGDFQSQMERTEMFKKSIEFTIGSPLFGVGPGQFPDQVWSRAKQLGKRTPSLGTHNTYTQLASEMGIPSLLIYLAALTGCFRLMYRLYIQTPRSA
ncbi:MAG: O-antigen ligase family protein [Acidobacteriota bacterium]